MTETTDQLERADRLAFSEGSPRPSSLSALLPTVNTVLDTARRLDNYQRKNNLELPTTFGIYSLNRTLPILRDRVKAEIESGSDDLSQLNPEQRRALLDRLLDRPNLYQGGKGYPYSIRADGRPEPDGAYGIDIQDTGHELQVAIGVGFYPGDLLSQRPGIMQNGRDLTRTLGAVGGLDPQREWDPHNPERRITAEQVVEIHNGFRDLTMDRLSSFGIRAKSKPSPDVFICDTNLPGVDLQVKILAGNCHKYTLIQRIPYRSNQ